MGVFYAVFLIEKVLYSFLLTETLSTYVGTSIVAGIVWRRANRWGALTSLVVALGTNFGLYWLRGDRLDHWNATVFFVALMAGIVSLLVVSLLTAPEPEPATTSFMARLQTPSNAPASETSSSVDHPDAHRGGDEASRFVAEQGKQLLLINLLHLRRATFGVGFFRAYREDLVGLGITWGFTAGLVAAVWLLFRA
jgi:hypothetical protein